MTTNEKAQIMLDVLDRIAPTSINWIHQKEWIASIELGFKEIERREEKSNEL
jgi:hypothetical protein